MAHWVSHVCFIQGLEKLYTLYTSIWFSVEYAAISLRLLLVADKGRPGNNSQLSCSLARKSENFCGKYVIYAEKMQNIRRKCIEINSFYRNSKKSIEKLDGSQHSQNIFDKPQEIFQIISASLNNFLQLGC